MFDVINVLIDHVLMLFKGSCVFLQIWQLNEHCTKNSCSNFYLFMGSNKNKQKTKVVSTLYLVNEDEFERPRGNHK
jgi:hypothetical protein